MSNQSHVRMLLGLSGLKLAAELDKLEEVTPPGDAGSAPAASGYVAPATPDQPPPAPAAAAAPIPPGAKPGVMQPRPKTRSAGPKRQKKASLAEVMLVKSPEMPWPWALPKFANVPPVQVPAATPPPMPTPTPTPAPTDQIPNDGTPKPNPLPNDTNNETGAPIFAAKPASSTTDSALPAQDFGAPSSKPAGGGKGSGIASTMKTAFDFADADKILSLARKVSPSKGMFKAMMNEERVPALAALKNRGPAFMVPGAKQTKRINSAFSAAIKDIGQQLPEHSPLVGPMGEQFAHGAGQVAEIRSDLSAFGRKDSNTMLAPGKLNTTLAKAVGETGRELPVATSGKNKKMIHAIIKGHELDEAAVAPMSAFTAHGHLSPDVILREHNRVVTLPEEAGEAKGYIQALREGGPEQAQLRGLGVEFGKGERLSRHARKHVSGLLEDQARFKKTPNFEKMFPGSPKEVTDFSSALHASRVSGASAEETQQLVSEHMAKIMAASVGKR